MPRKQRHYLPGVPAHIIQRGNNRLPCFFSEDDYQFYMECLRDASKRFGCIIHAYVLMTNHSHLLMTPLNEDAIAKVMQSVGRRYVRYINQTYKRTGTLWEGRHKGNLVQSECYVLTCYRYIELNPVRAGIVAHPADYSWSSFQHNAQGRRNALLEPHEAYTALGVTAESRCLAYGELFAVNVDENLLKEIRDAAQFGTPLGNDRFRKEIEYTLGRRVGRTKRGRPRKDNPEDEIV